MRDNGDKLKEGRFQLTKELKQKIIIHHKTCPYKKKITERLHLECWAGQSLGQPELNSVFFVLWAGGWTRSLLMSLQCELLCPSVRKHHELAFASLKQMTRFPCLYYQELGISKQFTIFGRRGGSQSLPVTSGNSRTPLHSSATPLELRILGACAGLSWSRSG